MLQKNTARKIRQFIFSLPEGELFTTRHLMHLGSRDLLDQNLNRLVQLGAIVRISRGVFMRDTEDRRRPSVTAVAYAKAEAFSKDIMEVPAGYPLAPQGDNVKVFLCANGSGSFQYGETTVIFKRISARKFYDLKDAELHKRYPTVFDCSPERHSRIDKENRHTQENEADDAADEDEPSYLSATVEYEFVVSEDFLCANNY